MNFGIVCKVDSYLLEMLQTERDENKSFDAGETLVGEFRRLRGNGSYKSGDRSSISAPLSREGRLLATLTTIELPS